MKGFATPLAAAVFAVLIAVPSFAQAPKTTGEEHAPSTAAPGMMPGTMPMMDMCRQMMGDSMSMPAMGDGPADAKHHALMLEMRGEMMKAMGDIMLKHARRMQGTEAR